MNRDLPVPRYGTNIPSLFTLSLWLFSKNKGILAIIGFSLLTSITVICASPLYTNIAQTASLHDFLQSSAYRSQIELQSQGTALYNTVSIDSMSTKDALNYVHALITHTLKTDGLTPYISTPNTSVTLDQLELLKPQGQNLQPMPHSTLTMSGYNIAQVSPHLHLLQGRFPSDQEQSLEVALSDNSANMLHDKVGSTIWTRFNILNTYGSNIPVRSYTLPIKVVGIFHTASDNDLFWKGTTFQVDITGSADNPSYDYPLLMSQTYLVQLIDTMLQQTQEKTGISEVSMTNPLELDWQYSFDTARIKNTDYNALTKGITTFSGAGIQGYYNSSQIGNVRIIAPSDDLNSLQQQIQIAQLTTLSFISITCLLLLYFISVMSSILVERHATDTARLRSRGTSRWQVFTAQALQISVLGLLALGLGAVLAPLLAYLLARFNLSAVDIQAINTISADPSNGLQQMRTVLIYGLPVMIVAIAVALFALFRTTSLNILTARKDMSRSTQKPLWVRLNLDLIAVVIILVLYGINQYLVSSQVLSDNLLSILLSPITLASSLLLTIAVLLLFLRIFPWLIEHCLRLFDKQRNATFTLALNQLTRSPRQSLRLTLLLSLAIAFMIFGTVLYASQTQRDPDVATQLLGANARATFDDYSMNAMALKTQSAQYAHLKGVQSVTFGSEVTDVISNGASGIQIPLLAVDADTFAQTLIKPSSYENIPIDALIQDLEKGRTTAIQKQAMPALVDTTIWNELHLRPGATFSIMHKDLSINCIAIAEIPQIPTFSTGGGIMVDLKTFSVFNDSDYRDNNNRIDFPGSIDTVSNIITSNEAWFRTDGSPQANALIRQNLAHSALAVRDVEDLLSLSANSRKSPFYAQISGVLLLGSITALLLSLAGNFLASWFTMQDRLDMFILLRAIGAEQKHLRGILIVENLCMYLVSLILGVIFGVFLAITVVPLFVFTSLTSAVSSALDGNDLVNAIALQRDPPVHIVFPSFLIVGVVLLSVVCIAAISMMIRFITKPSVASSLRLNAD